MRVPGGRDGLGHRLPPGTRRAPTLPQAGVPLVTRHG
ncbi:hypothetical protein Ae150APs1_5391c [Pseudonocardia sp. Ae150A_Ps1]|nr:hypothetical protein Ae150APs1_5391c [Pseudonocardia sp. Ae150A_Ps1]